MKLSFAVGAAVGVVLTLLEQRKSWRKWVPSPTGMGTGMIIPASTIVTMFVGALLDWIWSKLGSASHARFSIPIAAGLIAGEALVAVIIPLLVLLGWMTLPG
jgi:uncharacterized oligopeptide transporter (OPT) family protein